MTFSQMEGLFNDNNTGFYCFTSAGPLMDHLNQRGKSKTTVLFVPSGTVPYPDVAVSFGLREIFLQIDFACFVCYCR